MEGLDCCCGEKFDLGNRNTVRESRGAPGTPPDTHPQLTPSHSPPPQGARGAPETPGVRACTGKAEASGAGKVWERKAGLWGGRREPCKFPGRRRGH